MTLESGYVKVFLVHMIIWTLLYGFFLFPFFFQLRQIPPDLPMRLGLTIVLFYINYFYLVPRILLEKGTGYYVLVCLGLIGISIFIMDFGIAPQPQLPPKFPDNIPPPRNEGPFHFLFTMINLSTPFFVSSFLRIYLEWRKNEDIRKKVENEKVNSELQFLKTQLNPHFLFNSLNTVYSLSVKKSPDTPDAIISLSEMMRYMLYEADKDKVPLSKELEYIKNYVQLQKLRLSDSANVNLKISGEDRGREIAPLMFISFIENAFKYGTDYTGKTFVNISLIIEESKIKFTVENRIGVSRKQVANSGVGLENTKNRLQLLYPKSHDLQIWDDGKNYVVHLSLNLQPKL